MSLPAPIEMTWADLLELYLQQRDMSSQAAARNEGYTLRDFLRRYDDPSLVQPGHVRIWAYAARIERGKPPSPKTIRNRLIALANYYKLGIELGLLAHNPAEVVSKPRLMDTAPKGLTAAEVRRLWLALPVRGRFSMRVGLSRLRVRAIILTALGTGLRRGELWALTGSTLRQDEHGEWRYGIRGKAGRVINGSLPQAAVKLISEVLAKEGRRLHQLQPDECIWSVSQHTAYLLLRRAGERAGVKAGPHILRHAAAQLRLEGGWSVDDLQLFLHHRDPRTTRGYTKRLDALFDRHGADEVFATLGLDKLP